MNLTSSNFAAAVGLNPYQSRQKLWRVLMGLESRPFVSAMQWGIDHEKDAVAGAEAITGDIFRDTGERQRHYTLDRYGTTPDGRIGDTGLEVKCPREVWEEPPAYYLPQLIGQARIAGFRRVIFSCWTPSEQRAWVYVYDASHWDWLEPLLAAFLIDVDAGTEPKRAKKPVLPELILEPYDEALHDH